MGSKVLSIGYPAKTYLVDFMRGLKPFNDVQAWFGQWFVRPIEPLVLSEGKTLSTDSA